MNSVYGNGAKCQGTLITASPALAAPIQQVWAPAPGGWFRSLYPAPAAQVPLESSLQPSPEQAAIIAARRAEPDSSLQVVAFAGSGKTTALCLLAEADSTPALYLAYNKSTQLAAQQHFPAHVACRTMHSLASRARRMAEQQPR